MFLLPVKLSTILQVSHQFRKTFLLNIFENKNIILVRFCVSVGCAWMGVGVRRLP